MGRSGGSQNKISKTTSVTTRGGVQKTVFEEIKELAQNRPWEKESETLNSRIGRKATSYLGDYQEAKDYWLSNLDGYSDEEAEALWQATRAGYLKSSGSADENQVEAIKNAFSNHQLINKDGAEIISAKELEEREDDDFQGIDYLLEAAVYEGYNLEGLNCHSQHIGPGIESLEGLDAVSADFSQGSFTWLSLDGSSLNNANFQGTTFNGISFNDSRADGSDFSFSNFIHSDLDYSSFQNSDFSNSVMINCNLTGSGLESSNFQGALLDRVKFSDERTAAQLEGANFQGAVILNSDLRGLDLSIFEGADIRSCITD